jgi:hypothetical protein
LPLLAQTNRIDPVSGFTGREYSGAAGIGATLGLGARFSFGSSEELKVKNRTKRSAAPATPAPT